jgi:hypothetical protein
MDAEVVQNVNVARSRQVLVRLDWSEVEQTPAYHVNQVLAQVGPPSSRGVPDGIYVALGSVAPPVIPADEDRREARLEELADSVLKVMVHARVQLSREALQELIQVLQTTAAQYDETVKLAADSGKQE